MYAGNYAKEMVTGVSEDDYDMQKCVSLIKETGVRLRLARGTANAPNCDRGSPTRDSEAPLNVRL